MDTYKVSVWDMHSKDSTQEAPCAVYQYETPKGLNVELAITIGRGIAWEHDWSPIGTMTLVEKT